MRDSCGVYTDGRTVRRTCPTDRPSDSDGPSYVYTGGLSDGRSVGRSEEVDMSNFSDRPYKRYSDRPTDGPGNYANRSVHQQSYYDS